MLEQKIIPLSKSSNRSDMGQYLSPHVSQAIRCAAHDNIERLRSGANQCLHLAVVTSEDVAAAMIDHAIELSAQAFDAAERYGEAVKRWHTLATI